MSRNSQFKNLSVWTILLIFILAVALLIAAVYFSAEIFRIIFIFIAFLLLIVLMLFIAAFAFTEANLVNCGKNREEPYNGRISRSFFTVVFRLYMPLLLFASNVFGCKKDEIRRVFIEANNKYVLSLNKKVSPEQLLVILPHCLQWSECSYRIREGLNDCRQCCRCTLGKIKDLANKFGVNVALATGGTSARKAVRDLNPGFVIAVACERDLASGIMDVKEPPVYGIINLRPHGPCRNTWVDTEELERVLKLFLINRDE